MVSLAVTRMKTGMISFGECQTVNGPITSELYVRAYAVFLHNNLTFAFTLVSVALRSWVLLRVTLDVRRLPSV